MYPFLPLRRLVMPLVLLLALPGCESAADRALKRSPDFKAGYSDGCGAAGTQGANPRDTGTARDEDAYRSNKAYRTGWGTGFNACRIYQPQSGQPDHSITADPDPGGMP
jgi:hypothetical protein